MRISGNILEFILKAVLPVNLVFDIFIYAFDRISSYTPGKYVILFLSILGFQLVAIGIGFIFKKYKALRLTDDKIILANKVITVEEIVSIQYINLKSPDYIQIIMKENGENKKYNVLDKPKFFYPFRRGNSKTLELLFSQYPQLKEKKL